MAAPEGWRPAEGELAALRRLVGDWHDPIPALLERIEPGGLLRHDVHHLTLLPTYVRGRRVLCSGTPRTR